MDIHSENSKDIVMFFYLFNEILEKNLVSQGTNLTHAHLCVMKEVPITRQ